MAPQTDSVMIQAKAEKYFDMMSYLLSDLSMGTLHNRSGTKLCSLTLDFFRGMHAALNEETGEAWPIVLYRCGLIWGERLGVRLSREFEEYYGNETKNMNMAFFVELLENYFSSHGWGKVRFSFDNINSGIIEVSYKNPIYATVVKRAEKPVESLMAGLLGGLFSHYAQADLLCHQTECVALGAADSMFILSDAERLDSVPEWVEAGDSHKVIIDKLLAA